MREARFVKALSVALPVHLYEYVKFESDEQHISIAEVMRNILEDYKSKKQKDE